MLRTKHLLSPSASADGSVSNSPTIISRRRMLQADPLVLSPEQADRHKRPAPPLAQRLRRSQELEKLMPIRKHKSPVPGIQSIYKPPKKPTPEQYKSRRHVVFPKHWGPRSSEIVDGWLESRLVIGSY